MEEDVARIFKEADKQLDSVDVLVNNAAVGAESIERVGRRSLYPLFRHTTTTLRHRIRPGARILV